MTTCYTNGWCDDDRCLKHISHRTTANERPLTEFTSVLPTCKAIIHDHYSRLVANQWNEVIHTEYDNFDYEISSNNSVVETMETAAKHNENSSGEPEDAFSNDEVESVVEGTTMDSSRKDDDETNASHDILFQTITNKFMYM